ncbi:hypothetical protein SNE40_002967 [Patella caerulea]|uniref:Uncharacterized protein n=1 Tax=Patella caerulea TaxID=87958 RepID=A0AAN8K8S6_PATCE
MDDLRVNTNYLSSPTATSTPGECKRLRLSAVPHVFSWTKKETQNAKAHRERLQKRMVETTVETCKSPDFENEVVIDMEIDSCLVENSFGLPMCCDKQIQADSDKSPPFGIDRFIDDPEAILYYTGLNTYNRFKFVLNALGSAAYELNYSHSNCKQLSIAFFYANEA